ncbi:DegQ family serine endoprotease [Parendozoicomonas haliclonae]|uniref:Probable periplasmic serine endoprotease DegP-like n=1 Tax=Parendozoicomonas haliclonae TaxID=1960125 RepID=A0A1X7AQ50_9GAMM|nr:DegQ family serine endoprotease [Parendozoicomonas haliclonae]SMA50451.1 putative periplasmic serine endoprotease DegP-like precursor [Parendozoicomonas haliclonae]
MSKNGSRSTSQYERPISRKALLFTFCLAVVGSLTFAISKPAEAKDQLPDFSTLAEQTSPAIVNISTMTNPKRDRNQMYGPYGEELPEILRRYFGLQVPDGRGGSRQEQPQPQSLGSGFIISKDGYVLTNNHVIEGADEIIVRMNDRSEYKAKLIGADKKSDLALLKVDGKNLPTVKIGQSENLKPGQWVFAIGSPFGFDYSVTKGIISALNRSLPRESYVPFIQTDVPINPGNSGGPLLNMQGEVIGINSQIYTRSGGFMGLSFAIPVDDAMDVVAQLKENGQVSRGWLGVIIQDVDRDLADSFGLDRPHGALLSQVLPEGPADKGGLQAGDIITRFNDREIKFSSDLPIAVGRAPIGKEVEVELVRRGKKKTLELAVGELPDEQSGVNPRDGIRKDNRLGISVTALDEAVRSRLGLDSEVKGVVVTEVGQGVGRAYGLRSGDVITQINHENITSTKEYQKVTADLPVNKTISMRLIRRGTPGFITFRLAE